MDRQSPPITRPGMRLVTTAPAGLRTLARARDKRILNIPRHTGLAEVPDQAIIEVLEGFAA